MWLFTRHGFYSIVQHNQRPDTLMLRARIEEDLHTLKDFIEECEEAGELFPLDSYEVDFSDGTAADFPGAELRASTLRGLSQVKTSAVSDYRHRVYLQRHEAEEVARLLLADVTYPNFKNEVYRAQGPYRAGLYSQVWAAVEEMQRRPEDYLGHVDRSV